MNANLSEEILFAWLISHMCSLHSEEIDSLFVFPTHLLSIFTNPHTPHTQKNAPHSRIRSCRRIEPFEAVHSISSQQCHCHFHDHWNAATTKQTSQRITIGCPTKCPYFGNCSTSSSQPLHDTSQWYIPRHVFVSSPPNIIFVCSSATASCLHHWQADCTVAV